MASSSRNSLLCGPEDPSVLYLQNNHISLSVWAGNQETKLNCRRYEGKKAWDMNGVHPVVIQYIRMMGFGGLLDSRKPRELDHSLITALVERWRPETHTFHLPVGEATVTLEDVQVIWGLRVDGRPVTGNMMNMGEQYWKTLCYQLLCIVPNARELKSGGLLASSLITNLQEREHDDNDEASLEYLIQQARVYCLLLLCGLVLPETTGNKIPFHFIAMLEDAEAASEYSWGGAALACLYHNLCEAACGKKTEIGGPLSLLQMWAFERMPTIRPDFLYSAIYSNYTPSGLMWTGPTSFSRTPQHSLAHFRDQLARLHDGQFIWEPYLGRKLPAMCIEGEAIWMTNTYLICWHMVEPHRPERVLRQFGLRQHIVPNEGRYHSHARFKSNRRGMAGTNWEMYHRDQIEHWNNRHYHVFHIPDTQELRETEAYMDWYRRITVSYLTQPGMHPQEGYHEAASSYQFLVSV